MNTTDRIFKNATADLSVKFFGTEDDLRFAILGGGDHALVTDDILFDLLEGKTLAGWTRVL